ncbi:DUF732 domain-containing protein [Mycolicibacter minnesotensis]
MKHRQWSAIALGAAALIHLAVPAQADPAQVAAFLAAVDKAGIEYTDPQDAVAIGLQICEYRYSGHGPDAAARAVKIANRSISAKNAARFVVFAEKAFCPDQFTEGAPK